MAQSWSSYSTVFLFRTYI